MPMPFLNFAKFPCQAPFFSHLLVALAAEFLFFPLTLLLDLLRQHLSLKPLSIPILLRGKLVHAEKVKAPMIR